MYKPSKKDRSYFKAAAAVSDMSDYPQHRIGCVVVDKHHIIGSGCNSRTKCHPIQAEIDTKRYGCQCRGAVHAETAALIPLIARRYDLSNASIYLYRQHKNGVEAISRPCSGCRSLLSACGISNIFYTTESGYCHERL